MALFGKKKEGGWMDVIRCDLKEYLMWKWTPNGEENTTAKENAIRYGSTLRVKPGEVAVFFYRRNEGSEADYIVGPCDQTIKTANFPVLSRIVGAAYGGESPFQAEVYFINLASIVQVRFGVPWFDVFDPRFLDFGVPFAVRGVITFNITDYKRFIELHRLITFNLEDFKQQVSAAVSKYVKHVLMNVPSEHQIPVLQINKKILDINKYVEDFLRARFTQDFGVNLTAVDISDIDVDKESKGYAELYSITATQQKRTIDAQTDVNIRNLDDTQRINADNMEETLRIQREEMQKAQRLQTETNFMGAHALDQQTEVLKTAAQNLGTMGTMDGGGGGGMNPAGMMTGMMMGGAMGGQMANMMNQMGGNMAQSANTPPPLPTVQYMLAVNGQQSGPFSMDQLRTLAGSGQLTRETLVWKQGMPNWAAAGSVPEVAQLFAAATPPPIPPVPPIPTNE